MAKVLFCHLQCKKDGDIRGETDELKFERRGRKVGVSWGEPCPLMETEKWL